jgi:hypothetical protein
VVTAGLGREGTNGSIELLPPGSDDVEPGSGTDLDAESKDASSETERDIPGASARRGHGGSTQTPILHQEWTIPGGRIVFEVELDRPLAGAAFGEVGSAITAIERFADTLQVNEGEPEADDVASE